MNILRTFISRLTLLGSSRVPWTIRIPAILSVFQEARYRETRTEEKKAFIESIADKKFSELWFLNHFAIWLAVFEKLGAESRPRRVLEIGSWEGLSTFFLARNFPDASIDCVDTWEGSVENSAVPDDLFSIFILNLREYRDRIHPFRMRSQAYFALDSDEIFDLIYVDGSHWAPDVILDAVCGWQRLRTGGLLIFDDFLWNYYENPRENPCEAISSFLRLFNHEIEVVHAGYQLFLRKRI